MPNIIPDAKTFYKIAKLAQYKLFLTKKNLISSAEVVLRRNDIGGKIIPAPHLYPHQWFWDSCLSALGLSLLNWERAVQEIHSILEGQWKDGFIPHIRFAPEAADYWPNGKFWQTKKLKNSPKGKGIETSGITQPPVIAFCAWQIFKNAPKEKKKEAKKFLRQVYPKIKKYHKWLKRYRDPADIGLLYIIHPWESGLDNLPVFNTLLTSICKEVNKRIRNLVDKKRYDNKVIPPSERPKQTIYYGYASLVQLFIKLNYNPKKIYNQSPFLVQDVLFNSIWHQSNLDLVKIAKELKHSRDEELFLDWAKQTKKAINKRLWDRKDKLYYDYDLRNGKRLRIKTITSLTPLFGRIPQKRRAQGMVKKRLTNAKEFWPKYPIPSTSKDDSNFDPKRYWSGPVWIITNWFLIKGLKSYGYKKEAKKITEKTIELILKNGFREHFNPLNGGGGGDIDHSWSAALIIDLLKTP